MKVQVGDVVVTVTGEVPERTISWFAALPAGPADVAADIELRFRDDLRTEGRPLLGTGWLWADATDLWVADHHGRGARLPLPRLTPVEVDRRLDPGLVHAAVLVPLLRAATWRRGGVLLRAAGIELDGRRIVATGWSGSGKTGLVVAALRRGGAYLGDDWVALGSDGTVAPVPARLFLRDRTGPDGAPHRTAAMAERALRRASRGTDGRMSRVLDTLADWAFHAGTTEAVPGDLVADARIATRGRLDTIVVLDLGGCLDGADTDLAAEVLAASSQGFVAESADVEAAHRSIFPGRFDEPLFPTFAEEQDRIRTLTADVPVSVAGAIGADGPDGLLDRVLDATGRPT